MGEPFPAVGARERLLPAVYSDVLLQVVLIMKQLGQTLDGQSKSSCNYLEFECLETFRTFEFPENLALVVTDHMAL